MSQAPAHFDLRNVNALWGSVLAHTLRHSIQYAVVSPGSRSAPLAFAFARHPEIEAIPVLDERSAAFFALGLARQLSHPVALVCTSGTAAANFLPAIVEAHESGTPLLVLTADRPPELRDCASGQTIDQQKLYGSYVGFSHELALPELNESRLRYLRQTVMHAVRRTLRPFHGPVHLNVPFRDPLPPLADDGATEKFAATIDWAQFFQHIKILLHDYHATGVMPQIVTDVHGLIIAGPEQNEHPEGYAENVGLIAKKLGWPVLVDSLNSLRHQRELVPHLVTTYDTILRNEAAAERLRPEIVLCLAAWPTSKVLRAWLEKCDAPMWLMSDQPDNRDALHGRTNSCPLCLGEFIRLLPEAQDANGYERMWAAYERKARVALDEKLHAMPELFEGKAAWLLAQHLPKETPLFIANSMPVRDVEYFWPTTDRHIRPFVNRGANGIDGTLSTALGIAHGAQQPAVLLTGDLALLHDTNGFLLRPKLRGSLTVVLINNRGGGIFEHLPVAQFEPPFEEFFATPQEADFAKLCAAYGAEHVLVRDWAHFTSLVSALPASGVRVLEIRTDRKRDAATRKQWFAEVAASLG